MKHIHLLYLCLQNVLLYRFVNALSFIIVENASNSVEILLRIYVLIIFAYAYTANKTLNCNKSQQICEILSHQNRVTTLSAPST